MLVGEVNVASSVIYLSVHFPSGEKAGKRNPSFQHHKGRRMLTRLCQVQDARMTTSSPSSQQLFHFSSQLMRGIERVKTCLIKLGALPFCAR